MKKKILILIFIIFVFSVSIFWLCLEKAKQNKVCFKSHCFSVELAKNQDERERGLMFREKLDQNKGMLFIFDTVGEYSIWMKNTLIPLDIIWIDKNGLVVFISKNVQPCSTDFCPSINPRKNALYILEIHNGMTNKIGLGVGDKTSISIK